ncbi:MAG: hypothetical protein FWH14_07035 [Oscillospiraceae bacterium]|nr:hypothetical protein [Oscillospiraceae bacterium]
MANTRNKVAIVFDGVVLLQLTVDNVQLTVIVNIDLLVKVELDFYNYKPP